jgi:uncharacterized protein YuzE
MKIVKGKMNVDFEENYDQDADIYYVTFKTGEPSYAIEIDDIILLEVGLFTNMPTGFRILNYKSNPVHQVQINVLIKKVKETVKDVKKEVQKELRDRFHDIENQLGIRLEQTLAY